MSVRARRAAAVVALPTVIMTGVGVAAAAAGPTESSPRPAAAVPAYAGSAYGLKAQIGLAGSKLIDQILPAVVTFPSGGDESLLELPSELSEAATVKVLNASSMVKDGVLRSNAKTAGLTVVRTLVTASVLNADCTAEGEKVSGDAQVADLAIAGIKVPVDPGPNFKIAIPDALGFLSGGIIVDRQDVLKSGALRVRALDVRLVADLAGLNKALESLVAEVRAAAQKVAAAIEEATGQTIEVLAARQRLVRSALPALPGGASDGAGTHRAGAASERSAVRAEYAAKQARGSAERDAALLEREARAKEAAYAAAQRRAAEARAEAAGADSARLDSAHEGAGAGAQADTSRTTGKADRADVGREIDADAARGTSPGQAPGADAPQGGTAKVDGAEAQAAEARATSPDPATPDPATTDPATTDPATTDPATKDPATPDGAESDPTRAAEQAEAEADAKQAGVVAADARKAADAARVRADAARAPSAKSAAAQKGIPAAPIADPDEEENLGLVGVNVIVSQVICKGAKVLHVRTVPEAPAPPAVEKEALPRTGGNGTGSAGLGAIGFGLLAVGSAAVYVTRRRARHSV